MTLFVDPRTGIHYRLDGNSYVPVRPGMSETSRWAIGIAGAIAIYAAILAAPTPRPVSEPVGEAASSEVGATKEGIIRTKRGNHFLADTKIGNHTVLMMVDTGASAISINHADAKKAGVDVSKLSYDVIVGTMNGMTSRAMTTIPRVTVGGVTLTDVKALVGHPGRESPSLLGMSFLERLQSFEFRGNELILRAK